MVNNNYIVIIYWICIWGLLNNIISYTEELMLSLIYISLFMILNNQSKEAIKLMIISKSVAQILCYEQINYLKIKVILKNLKMCYILLKKKYIEGFVTKIEFKIKKQEKKNILFKKKIFDIIKEYYIFIYIIGKIKGQC